MTDQEEQEMKAQILKYGEVKESPANRPGLLLSQLLRKGRDFVNDSPMFGSSDLGNLIMGKAPEAIEDYAYGSSPLRGKGWTTYVDPRVLDIAAMPFVGGTLAKTFKSVKSPLAKALVGEEGVAVNEERRNFLKQGSALAASATAGGAVPDAVKLLLKEVAPAVGVQGAKIGMGTLAATLAANSMKWAKLHGEKFMEDAGWQEYTHKELVNQTKEVASSPEFVKKLSQAIGDISPENVDPNFLTRLHGQMSHNDFYRGTEREIKIPDVPDWANKPGKKSYEYWEKRTSDLRNKIENNAETAKQFEELVITGKLPKDADPVLATFGSWDASPKNSKLADLMEEIQHSMSHGGHE